MNGSIHRFGVAVATVAVVVTVGAAFVLDGYLTAQRAASADPTTPQVIYVRPAPSPQVLHTTQTAPAAAPQVVDIVVPGAGEDDGK